MQDYSKLVHDEVGACEVAQKLIETFLKSNPEAAKFLVSVEGAEDLGRNIAIAYLSLAKTLTTGN